jgi:hypothetical protein
VLKPKPEGGDVDEAVGDEEAPGPDGIANIRGTGIRKW